MTQKAPATSPATSANIAIPRLSESKLKELSWSLDVKSNNSLNQEKQEENEL